MSGSSKQADRPPASGSASPARARRCARLLVAVLLAGLCAASSVACSANEAGEQTDCEPPALIDDPLFDGGAAGDEPHHDPNHDARWRCDFQPEAMPRETVSGDIEGLRNNVKHVFVLMLENRSFDQFLSGLPDAGVTDVDVATNETNPKADGTPVARYATEHLCLEDLSHEWLASHAQFDGGKNDGFVASGGRRAMAYYGPDQLPFHYFLANTFAISDRYFASVMGPTWPNHLFFWSGTSCGFAEDAKTNPAVISQCGLKAPSLFTKLRHHIDVFDDSGELAVGSMLGSYRVLPKTMADFEAAVAQETPTSSVLPEVVMLGAIDQNVPLLRKVQNDDHASVNVQLAQEFIFKTVQLITANDALWRSSVLFIAWDEHGGFYDHVPPPKACQPEADPRPNAPRFDRLGFRVPLYVVSPFVRRHYVSHYVTEHSSILRFIETWLDMPAFTKRDANAWAMLDFFDFAHPNFEVPTLDPAMATPSPEGLAACAANPKGYDDE